MKDVFKAGAASPGVREFVLGEIRRLTAGNGGIVPGHDRFHDLTGIPHSWWRGEIWVRWNDAVREAGLTPNTTMQRREDEKLLAEFAAAMRALGHIPTNPETRRYRKTGGRLSVEKTYQRHFGAKRSLLRHVKLWAQAAPERADILAMLSGISEHELELPRSSGAVYLLRSGSLFKIGFSRKPESRTRTIRSVLPLDGEVLHVIATDDPRGLETYWHGRFAAKRVRGEWFELSADDVAAFRARKTQ